VTSAGKELVMVDPESPTEEPLVYQVGNGRGPGPKSNNLYVCGLDAEIDDAKFEEVFSKFGTVLSAKVMVDIHTGVSRGFGFILFETLEQGVAAQEAMNGRLVFGKHVTVRYSGQHQTTHLLAKQPSMYVRNVPRMTPREALLKHFGKFGAVQLLEIMRDTAKGATGANVVVKVMYPDGDTCDHALRATHCCENPFATHVPAGEAAAVRLLAKFAETVTTRVPRRAPGDATAPPAAPPPVPGYTFFPTPAVMPPMMPSYPALATPYPPPHSTFAPQVVSPIQLVAGPDGRPMWVQTMPQVSPIGPFYPGIPF